MRATLAAIRPARRNLPLVGPPLVVALPAGARLVIPRLIVPGLGISRLGISRLGVSRLGVSRLGVSRLGVSRLGVSRLLVSRPVVPRLARMRLFGTLRARRGQRPGPLRYRGR